MVLYTCEADRPHSNGGSEMVTADNEYGYPVALLRSSQETLEILVAAGATGMQLSEQGAGWATWILGDTESLLVAARALIEAGYPRVDMRYEARNIDNTRYQPGRRELYVSR